MNKRGSAKAGDGDAPPWDGESSSQASDNQAKKRASSPSPGGQKRKKKIRIDWKANDMEGRFVGAVYTYGLRRATSGDKGLAAALKVGDNQATLFELKLKALRSICLEKHRKDQPGVPHAFFEYLEGNPLGSSAHPAGQSAEDPEQPEHRHLEHQQQHQQHQEHQQAEQQQQPEQQQPEHQQQEQPPTANYRFTPHDLDSLQQLQEDRRAKVVAARAFLAELRRVAGATERLMFEAEQQLRTLHAGSVARMGHFEAREAAAASASAAGGGVSFEPWGNPDGSLVPAAPSSSSSSSSSDGAIRAMGLDPRSALRDLPHQLQQPAADAQRLATTTTSSGSGSGGSGGSGGRARIGSLGSVGSGGSGGSWTAGLDKACVELRKMMAARLQQGAKPEVVELSQLRAWEGAGGGVGGDGGAQRASAGLQRNSDLALEQVSLMSDSSSLLGLAMASEMLEVLAKQTNKDSEDDPGSVYGGSSSDHHHTALHHQESSSSSSSSSSPSSSWDSLTAITETAVPRKRRRAASTSTAAAAVDPKAWLWQRGFDPDAPADLLSAKQTLRQAKQTTRSAVALAGARSSSDDTDAEEKEEPNVSTAMYQACDSGLLNVCEWLFEGANAQATAMLRTKNSQGRTPMFAACRRGHLSVAKWLFNCGAAPDIRTPGIVGWTPLNVACESGHLHMAKWLFLVGAADDTRTRAECGWTPFHSACESGRLRVAKWLFENGAAADIRAHDDDGWTPLQVASFKSHHHLLPWLIVCGGANDDDDDDASSSSSSRGGGGHVNGAWLMSDTKPRQRAPLRRSLLLLLRTHAIFTRVILPAVGVRALPLLQASGAALTETPTEALTETSNEASTESSTESPTETSASTESVASAATEREGGTKKCFLPMLVQGSVSSSTTSSTTSSSTARGGKEPFALLRLIGDFLGVPHGRGLRNVREAMRVLEELGDMGSDDDDDEDGDEEGEEEEDEEGRGGGS